MQDRGEIFHEEGTELLFDCALEVVPHEGDRIEGRRYFERFERVIAEDDCEALLPREDEDNEA